MHMRTSSHGYRGNGVLEDQLLLIIGLEHHRVFVKRTNTARQLYTTQQVNRDTGSFFPGGIQERVLNVLCRLIVHRRSPSFLASKAFLYCGSSSVLTGYRMPRGKQWERRAERAQLKARSRRI